MNLYFERLQAVMVKEGLDRGGSRDLYFVTLLIDPITHTMQRPENVWLLNRLLRVQNRLSYPLRHRLEDMLRRFLLSGSDECDGLPWNPERFRFNVYQDLRLGEYF
jgi:hypothetical protein